MEHYYRLRGDNVYTTLEGWYCNIVAIASVMDGISEDDDKHKKGLV